MGMMASRGRKIFFADADRAMPFTEFQKINEKFEYLHDKYPDLLVIGSRAHLEKESIAQRSLFRTILMKVSSDYYNFTVLHQYLQGFHLCVWIFCVQSVRDTQCGYKLFSRTAAQKILPNLHIQRWAFDVELLYIAESKFYSENFLYMIYNISKKFRTENENKRNCNKMGRNRRYQNGSGFELDSNGT